MKLYSGIDLHSNNSVVTIIDEKGLTVYEKRHRNDIETIKQVLMPYRDSLQGIVVESTYNWYWLVDGLQAEGFVVHLANTAAIQAYSGKKHTDDKSDARWLAEMLRLNLLPKGYIFPKETRAVRDLARKRLQIVSQRTRNVLCLQSMITRLTAKTLRCSDIKKMNEQDLQKILPDQNDFISARSNLHFIHHLDREETEIEKALLDQVKLTNSYEKLLLVPGVGKKLAITIMLETGDINRFSSSGNYASYCRCVGSRRESNGKKKGENNRKNGNQYLCWAFMEAANFAIRHYPVVQKFYQKKQSKKGMAIARKAIAHKLSRACYHVLKTGEEFEMSKMFM